MDRLRSNGDDGDGDVAGGGCRKSSGNVRRCSNQPTLCKELEANKHGHINAHVEWGNKLKIELFTGIL
ncbi:hypothetical protein NECAME_18983 [Necator americanus]|uniref:Uncharacterized protein n=1 Tax=Necator americanus TaxID=51031 RepID=W2SU05_NECAM|nr:hypothetical protein NECAME_18983 [Necator americanus]ETN72182.1 hypothetical protein NECAME_18983 [Necator americanus]